MKLTVYSTSIPGLLRLLRVSVSRMQSEYGRVKQPALIQPVASTITLIGLLVVLVGQLVEVKAQTLPCNYRTLTSNNFSNAGVINGRTGGVGGFLGFGTGSVTSATNVADASPTNSATITSAQFTGSGGQISVSADANGGTTIFGAGAIAGFLIGNNTALGNNLLPSVTIRTYLDGTLRESSTSSTLQDLTPLAGANQRALGFTTTLDFDEIQIVIANTVSLATSTAIFYPFLQYSALTVQTTVTNASSSTTANGALFATVSGGRSPYTYLWSNGATSQTVANVAPGTYTVRVTDANSCTSSATATVGVRVAPCPVPGQSGFTVFSFTNLSSNTGTGANTLARYSNVATIGVQAVDIIGDVLSLSVNGVNSPNTDVVDFFSSNSQAGFLISGANVRATVRWTVVRTGTTTPVPFQGSFTVGDLDRVGTAPTYTRTESLELDKSTLYSYKLNVPTSISVINQGTSIRFQATANNSANDNTPSFAVSLNFVGLPYFEITYNNIGSETASLFSFDGNGTIVFNSSTTCVPVLDTDGDGIADANDIDDDNDGIVDDTEGLLADVDGDGIANALDLDSDGDGIPDNIEAQTTSGYIVPTTTVTSLGLPTSYSSTGGLTPVNTDGDAAADYLDTDSDNDTKTDTNEAGLTLAGIDSDEDGVDNNIDTNDAGFGPVNAGITNPLAAYPSNNTQVYWRIKEGTFTYGACANATVGGTFIIGSASTGVLTIPITTTRDGQVVVTVTGSGFTASPTSVTTTLVTSQTALAIPIAYDGTGAVGSRTLTVSSAQATGTCSSTVAVIGLADPAISIAQPTPSLLVSQTSSLPITISNLGSGVTSGPITTTLIVPANVATPASFTSGGFACVTTGSAVTCTSSAVIAVGGSSTIIVPITPAVATASTTLSFTGIVGTTTPEITVNNDVAILSTTVSSSVTARPDAGTASAGTGGVAVANIAANDIVNTQAATLGAGGNATVSTVGTYPAGISLNATTGSISVAQGTVPGAYTLVYQLCDVLTPTTCATSVISLTITPSITANPDAGTVSAGTGGTAVADVRANDIVNGLPATGTNSSLSLVSSSSSNVSLNTSTGSVSVVQATTPGTYTLVYSLCSTLGTTTCTTGTAIVTVTPSVTANPDSGTVSAATGGTAVANVRANDVVNGLPATAANSSLSLVSTSSPNLSLNTTTGSISVVQATTPGSYTLVYSLCSTLGTTTCTTGTAIVTVTPSLTANPDSGTVSAGTGGTAVADVRANDVVNGLPATATNSSLSLVSTSSPNVSLNTSTGSVSVVQATTPGTYSLVYSLCSTLGTTTCTTGTVVVSVTPSLTANPDSGTISAATGGTAVANVRANDVVNGLPATGANSSLSLVSSSSPNLSLNTTTGSVSVVQATTPGTYSLVYSLCSTLGTTTCTTGTAIVTVTPSLTANPDSGTVSAATGGTAVANVRANDVVNGLPATGANSSLSIVSSSSPTVSLNPSTGSVSVLQATSPGTYTVVYSLCSTQGTTTCTTGTVAVTVTPSVTASPDAGTVSAGTGGTAVANVLANDVVNGVPATLVNASIAPVGTYPTGISLITGTGSVSVAVGTTPGTYTVAYQLCDRLTPTTCSTTTVTITITPSVIAVPDAGSVSSGTGGTAVANVAANDFVNGLPATLGNDGNATLSTSGTYAAGITLNTTTGAINVALSTTPGTYTVSYRLCDKLTSTCSTTTVSITVVPSSNPTPDSGTVCSGVAINNVAANDVVNGQPVVLGTNATITSSGTYPTGITLNTTTGAINVAIGTAAGTYPLVYQLCSTIGTPACTTSTATVTVNPAVTATLSSASICNGTSATLTATGGNSYRFGPGNTNASGLLIVAPTVIGVTPYSVTVTSGLGCSAVATGTVTVNALPQPTISGSTSLCAGQSIALTANPTTGLTYAWSGPGGNLGSSNPLIIPNSTTANSGTYQVRVTDANGCTALASQNVTVKPTPLAQILNTSIVCADNSPAVAIATQVTGGSPPVAYAWYRSGAVGVISTAPNPTFSIADTYSLVVTDASGCLSNTATVVVMTPDPLAVNIQTSNARCFGGQGTITVTTNGGTTPYTISYYNTSGLISSTQTTGVSTLTTVAGSYSIVVTDSKGCSLTQTATITQPPLLTVSLTGGGPVCAGQTTGTITSTATGGTPSYVYSWSTSTGPLPQTTPTLTGLSGGSYSVVVTDANGCTATNSITLPTNPLPSAPTVNVTQPTCITLTGTIQVLTPASGVQYSFNNGISYQASASLSGLQPDVYQLRVRDNGTGCESPITSVTINPVPSPPIVSITGSTTYCAGQPISLTANPISNVSYVWSGPDGNLGTANPVVVQNPTPAQSGTYRVQVTDVNGCTAVANTTVTVYPLPIATLAVNSLSTCYGQPISLTAGGGISYAFSPNVSGITGNVASFTAGLGTALYSVTATSAQGCISLPTTVTVTVSSCLSPVPDSGTVSAGTGGLAVVSVVTNDQVNLNPATLGTGGNATISPLGTYPNGISLNTSTGSVSVAQGTTPGLYTVTYQLCDRLTPTTCATTTVTVTVTPSLTANPDAGTVSAGTGGTAVANVVANDVVNGLPATLGAGGNAIIAPVGTYQPGINLSTDTGSISVAQGTTPGSYTLVYSLCSTLGTTTCTTGTAIVTVTPSLTANPDSGTVSAGTGGTAVADVRANDVVNGLPATATNSSLSLVSTSSPNVSLNTSTGSVSVVQATTPGTYSLVYSLCSTLGTTTCTTGTVVVSVTPSLTANPDSGTISAATGGTAVANVRANDVVNGLPATGANSSLSLVSSSSPNLSLNTTTGSVSVVQATTPGTYTLVYSLCSTLGTTTCTTGTAIVTVTPSLTANPDSGTVSAATGGTAVANVRANDVVNGLPATAANSSLSLVSSSSPNVSLNPSTGSVSVLQATTPGTYTVVYSLCSTQGTTTCTTGTVAVTVTPSVTASPDAGTVSAGTGGTAVANVLANDMVNGQAATSANSTLSPVDTYPTGISLNTTTGSVSVAIGTTPGSYTVAYQLCDVLTPTTCASTTIVITVTPSVTADPDAGTVSAGTGGTAVADVRANDVVNGLPATADNSSLSLVSTSSPTVSLNTSTGSVSVVQATTPGTYTLIYSLCSTLGTTTCTNGTVIVTVTSSVIASPDSGTVSAGTGGTAVANVSANDVVNGVAATLGADGNAVITPVDSYPAGINLDTTTGSVSVVQGTAPGSYTVAYQLCDRLTPTTCTTTTVTITISPSVMANPDSGTIGSGSGGTAVANVAANDVVNGLPATLDTGGNATITPAGTYPTGITLNTTTGVVSVAVGTAAGSYTIAYTLCDLLTPATCATTTITITVTAVAPLLTGDVTTTRPNTPVSGNVLTNDRDPQGLPLTATLLETPVNGSVVLNPDGSYTFTPTADFVGLASFCYSASNSAGLSASTCVSIDVQPDPDGGNARPIATNDNLRGFRNVPVRVVVLANDTDPNSATGLNGQLTTPTLVAPPALGSAVVNGDGSITYTPPTDFTGLISFVYQVCDRETPALCSTATVTINVLDSPPAGTTLTPVGVDDLLLTQLNATQTGSVAGNDYDPQGLALSYTAGQPTSGAVVMSPAGSYTYTPAEGFTGPASFTYQVCNTGGQCDVATVSVLVQPLPPTVRLSPQVYLQGALFGVTTGSLMRDDLRAAGYLPANHPYDALNPITPVGTLEASVTAVTGNDAIVDWVFVELHSATSPAVIVDSRAALLQRDGDIVEVDGVSSLSFAQSILGNYYVAVRHRNHLGVMSQSALLLSATAITVDFRNPNTPTYTSSGTTSYTQITADQAQVLVDQGVAMWAGNALTDNGSRAPRNLVIYQGSNNDVNQLYGPVIGSTGNILKTPFYKLRGYQSGDINLDGRVIFQGTNNDVEYIYQNIVKNHPGNALRVPFFIIREQVP